MEAQTTPLNPYKARYEKALKVIRKFKNQYHFETEVCKELARRFDELFHFNMAAL